jgi:hypothetical protein
MTEEEFQVSVLDVLGRIATALESQQPKVPGAGIKPERPGSSTGRLLEVANEVATTKVAEFADAMVEQLASPGTTKERWENARDAVVTDAPG